MFKPEWLRACIDAHEYIGFDATGITQTGVDASDEGGDIDAATTRKGSVVIHNENWNCNGDHDYSAGKANNLANKLNIDSLIYDSIGVGAGFKNAIKHVNTSYKINGWNAGGS